MTDDTERTSTWWERRGPLERKLVVLGVFLLAYSCLLAVVYLGAKAQAAAELTRDLEIKGTPEDPDVIAERARLEGVIDDLKKDLAGLEAEKQALKTVADDESPDLLREKHARIQERYMHHRAEFKKRFGQGR